MGSGGLSIGKWVYGGSVEIDEYPLYEALDRQARWFPNRAAMIYLGSKVTYRTLSEHSDRLASALRDFRVRRGDVVMLHMPNTPHFVAAYYAALKVGAAVSPVDPARGPEAIMRQAKDVGARVVFTMDYLYGNLVKSGYPFDHVIVGSRGDYLRRFWLLGRGGFRRCSVVRYGDLLRYYEPTGDREKVSPREDLAAINYTDGVQPRGVEVTHYGILANLHQVKPIYDALKKERGLRGPLMIMGLIPWSHAYGQVAVMHYSIFAGDTVVIPSTPEEAVEYMRRYRVQVLHGSPRLYEVILRDPGLRRVRSLALCVSSLSHLPRELSRSFREATGITIREAYFTTEALLTHISMSDEEGVGAPLPGVYAAIAHIQKPILLPPGEPGELVISGPQLMRGYRGFQCGDCFFEYGGLPWFRTGDIGYMERGRFYVIDRRDDLIKYKGYLIPPREIEDLARNHPCINDVCVVGVPSEEVGELPKAYVVLKDECKGKVTKEEILSWFQNNLPPYRRPRYVEFIDELPRTPTGRVIRSAMRINS